MRYRTGGKRVSTDGAFFLRSFRDTTSLISAATDQDACAIDNLERRELKRDGGLSQPANDCCYSLMEFPSKHSTRKEPPFDGVAEVAHKLEPARLQAIQSRFRRAM